ncbi:hypothetical protein CBR_g52154 [Chara braunii]|uniref:Uncharacterized protein n=1 Tax=Chara braunii TaxID=69332 RepID=A0A388M9Y3_CHABU|nr:hypothetical protein CBR_g52154 [Chara braunii]|eukprot:GBG91269.1 hypothetical protein CBR_g52154 [Chara braunii]
MQRKFKLGDDLLTIEHLYNMNRDDLTTIRAFANAFEKTAEKVPGLSEEMQCVIFLGKFSGYEAMKLTRGGATGRKTTWETIKRNIVVGDLDQVFHHQVKVERRKEKAVGTVQGTDNVLEGVLSNMANEIKKLRERVSSTKVLTVTQPSGKRKKEEEDEEGEVEEKDQCEVEEEDPEEAIKLTKCQRKARNIAIGGQGSDGDVFDKRGKMIDPNIPGGMREEALRVTELGPNTPTMFRIWEEWEDPVVHVEDITELEEKMSKMGIEENKEDFSLVEEEAEEEDVSINARETFDRMEDLVDKMQRLHLRLREICEEAVREGIGYPRVFTMGREGTGDGPNEPNLQMLRVNMAAKNNQGQKNVRGSIPFATRRPQEVQANDEGGVVKAGEIVIGDDYEFDEEKKGEFEQGEISEEFRKEEYDGFYLETRLLLSGEKRERGVSKKTLRMRDHYVTIGIFPRDEIEDDMIFDGTNLDEFVDSLQLSAERGGWSDEEKKKRLIERTEESEKEEVKRIVEESCTWQRIMIKLQMVYTQVRQDQTRKERLQENRLWIEREMDEQQRRAQEDEEEEDMLLRNLRSKPMTFPKDGSRGSDQTREGENEEREVAVKRKRGQGTSEAQIERRVEERKTVEVEREEVEERISEKEEGARKEKGEEERKRVQEGDKAPRTERTKGKGPIGDGKEMERNRGEKEVRPKRGEEVEAEEAEKRKVECGGSSQLRWEVKKGQISKEERAQREKKKKGWRYYMIRMLQDDDVLVNSSWDVRFERMLLSKLVVSTKHSTNLQKLMGPHEMLDEKCTRHFEEYAEVARKLGKMEGGEEKREIGENLNAMGRGLQEELKEST